MSNVFFLVLFLVLFLISIPFILKLRDKIFASSDTVINKFIAEKKFNKAKNKIHHVLSKTPDQDKQSQLHYKLGLCHENKNNLVHAIIEYKTSLKKSNGKDEKEIRTSLANVLLKLDKKEEALAQYLILLKYEKIEPLTYLNIGKIYYETSNYSIALDYFKKLIEIDSRNKEGIMYLGFTYKQLDNFADAHVLLKQSLRYFPNDPKLRFTLAKVCRKRHEYQDAHLHLDIAASKSQKYRDRSIFESALCYLDSNDMNNAILELEKIVQLDKGSKEIILNSHYLLSSCYDKQKNKEKVINELATIVHIDPNFKDAKEKLNKIKSEEQNDTVKDFLNDDDEEFIKKSSMMLECMELQLESTYRTQKGNFLFMATAMHSNENKNIAYVYISKNMDILRLEETKLIYEYIRAKNSNKLFIITVALVSKHTSEYANSHYINILNDVALYSLLQRVVTIKERPISTKFKNLPF